MRIGGAIGNVGDYTSTFNVAGLEVGGKIKTGDCAGGKIAQVGGLIGRIVQGSNEKYVTITGLSFSEFAMTVGKNGDKLNGAGGLLATAGATPSSPLAMLLRRLAAAPTP